jgi:3-oxoacyl-[acyl-carrier-protein] synthase-3
MGLHLHGVGHFHPEITLTNRFLEELDIGTDDAWIQRRVGIRTRRTVLPLDYIRSTRNREPRAALEAAVYSNAELAKRAAEMALARAGIDRDAIGMVIAGSSATDTVTPAEACNIARALGLEVPAFDVNSACTSFFAQLYLLSRLVPDPSRRFVLLAVPEGLTRTVDYTDRSAAVLWGDGAGAAVVSSVETGRAQILFSQLHSDPAGSDKVRVPRLGHFQQNGRAVQAFAIRRSLQVLSDLRRARGISDSERPLHFIGHQANLRMLESVCHEAGIAPECHHANVTEYGNTGAASVASVLSMHWEKWTGEEDVALVGVGAGLTWGGCLVRFQGAA